MLELRKITKVYEVGDISQVALDGVSVNFRQSEFAAILGPSGSGKTTLLNIVGGLDKYTDGDLVINNISTKKYKDSDWDSYRNHRIGFVFQSYNLISHQSILQNVILALTLSGISKKEATERAKQALIDVGLENHIYKKPNQLSGGQMQRVAIARALVNNPDILLADEPTGALDSATSVQIMKLLKKISKDKLVIMVTHNPELANKYANRIINLKDGKITSDSNPFDVKKEKTEEYVKTAKTSMSYFTALALSFNNLMTKKGRTVLVAFAGSIGIIGIALILSLSTGFQKYIDKLQEDTLSSYPLTITKDAADMTSMLLSMVGDRENIAEGDMVVEQKYVASMFSNIKTNDLKSFKEHLEKNYNKVEKDIATIKYSYSVDPLIYTTTLDGKIVKVNPNSMFTSMVGGDGITSLYSSYTSVFTQLLDDQEALDEQYDVLAGTWPKEYNEMVLVLPAKNAIPDMLVYFLGLRDIEELYDMVTKLMSGEEVEDTTTPLELSYEELMNIEFKLVNPADTYKYNNKYKIYENMENDDEFIKDLYKKSESLKIVGIVTAKEGVSSMVLSPGVAYRGELVDYIIDNSKDKAIVKQQIANKEIDVFTGKRFDELDEETSLDFEDMISIDEEMLQSAFNIKIDQKEMEKTTTNYMNQISESITTDTSAARADFEMVLTTFANDIFEDYAENPLKTMSLDPTNPTVLTPVMYLNDTQTIVSNFMAKDSSKKLLNELEKNYVIPANIYTQTLTPILESYLQGYIQGFYAQMPSLTQDATNPVAIAPSDEATISQAVSGLMSQAMVQGVISQFATQMTEAVMKKEILTDVGNLTGTLMESVADAFDVDPDKIAAAFKFDLSEEELERIMSAMMSSDEKKSAASNLNQLGYQDIEEPTSISFYFNSFDAKENFIEFIDEYNEKLKTKGDENGVIRYTDLTGILMSSVKTIVNSVTYVLIAFVSISLVVSSIMIGIITYISVFERTKEIGILRAIGASKGNISSIFNAETFIIGLLSGAFGISVTLVLIPVINLVIHNVTGNMDINAVLPLAGGVTLMILSIILTIIGGLIPSHSASKKDPVVALRTE